MDDKDRQIQALQQAVAALTSALLTVRDRIPLMRDEGNRGVQRAISEMRSFTEAGLRYGQPDLIRSHDRFAREKRRRGA
jgi:hypothetical protein